MLKTMLACCKLYISESRNTHALEAIEKTLKSHYPKTLIVNKFTDESYNRVGYTLVSTLSTNNNDNSNINGTDSPLMDSVFAMVKIAMEKIDLGAHSGTHPRLGVVDHVCFHPLKQTKLDQAAFSARSVAADIGSKLEVPTFLYGAAHQQSRTLASIRRELGYFRPNSQGNQWAGALDFENLPLKPDYGPIKSVRSKGVITIGATNWVDNYNIPVYSTDIELVKRIARRVSERGGGLESVQAMGLVHGDGSAEVACNLLDPSRVGSGQVQAQVEQLARELGLSVGEGYSTDFSQEKIVGLYLKSIDSE